MVNVSKLKGKIVESGYSIDELSYKIGIDKATFYRKLNSNGENFSVREANAIVKELKMNGEEAVSIFFA